MNVLSLFAGCGGSSLGWTLAGESVVAACEFDPNAVETYKLNFPKTQMFAKSVTELSFSDLESMSIDILDGSPPCQGFSMAGKRNPNDVRSLLWQEYLRILEMVRPKVLVMENVPGLAHGTAKNTLRQILSAINKIGYKVKISILTASDYGAATKRRRLFIIGFKEERHFFKYQFPKPCTKSLISLWPENVAIIADSDKLYLKTKALKLYQSTRQGENFSKAHLKLYGSVAYFNSIRLHPRQLAPTICKQVGLGRASYCHWEEPRLLTISEAKALQGFPVDFKFTGTFFEQWARIGNCVPPPLMRAIAHSIQSVV